MARGAVPLECSVSIPPSTNSLFSIVISSPEVITRFVLLLLKKELPVIRIFFEASKILTFYYSIKSLEQIFPWHHAAGDFIVKIKGDHVEVKLITVRGYDTLMESENPFLGLFFFFLNLSIRMRIDRNEGTKEYIFLDNSIVQASFDGFIAGLQENLKTNQEFSKSNPDFFNLFREFIKEFDLRTLLNVFIMIVDSYNDNAPEAQIIQENLEHHAKTIFECIQRI